MKDCFYEYRKGLVSALRALTYNGTNLVVCEYAEAEKETPYVQVLNMSSTYERDDDVFVQVVTTDIMVTTSHIGDPGNFGSKQSDDIMTIIMQRLITKGVTTADRAKHISMTGFTDNGCYFVSLNYQPEYDGTKTTIRKLLTISTLIDED
jgi:hypothetical protein